MFSRRPSARSRTTENVESLESPTFPGEIHRDGSMSAESRPTDVLEELRSGRPESLDKLSALLYSELREIAHRHRRARDDGGTLATTALVHEVYLKLVDQSRAGWNEAMRLRAPGIMRMTSSWMVAAA